MPKRPSTLRPAARPASTAPVIAYDRARGSARARGYTRRWELAAASHLRLNPLCRYCEAGVFGPARTTGAKLVDHLYPHRGDMDLFWSRQWWVSCCTACHSGPKQVLEFQGRAALDRLAARLGLGEGDLETSRP